MGSFFVNHQVRTQSASDVVAALRKLIRTSAYVAPCSNGWVGVYDEACDTQDEDEITRLGAALSQQLKTAVIALAVHDSDTFLCGSEMPSASMRSLRAAGFHTSPRARAHGSGSFAPTSA